METAQDRFWLRLLEYAQKVSYDEFVALSLFSLQEEGFYPEKIWVEDHIIFVGMYVADERILVALLPKDSSADYAASLEDGLKEKYPEYKEILIECYFERKCTEGLWLLCLSHKETIPPGLLELKKNCERIVKPLTLLDRLADRKPTLNDGTVTEFAESIWRRYDFWYEKEALDCFYTSYLYPDFNRIEIDGINGLRGDWNRQHSVAEAVKCLCRAGAKVTLQVWDLDSGFETLREELRDELRSNAVYIDRHCLDKEKSYML